MAEREGEGEQRGFKVVDRRRFTEEGAEREGSVPREEPTPVVKAASPAGQAAQAKPQPAAQPPQPQAGHPGAPLEEEDEGALTFSVFIQSLAQQCMMQLGLIPMPHTGQRELQLEAAQDTIDVLSLMKTKTKGNLTPQEAQLIDGVLYELRMTFVQLNQQLAAAAKSGGLGGPGGGPGGAGPKL